MYMYMYVCVCVCVCVYIYIGGEPGRGVLKTLSSLATPQVCSSKLGSKSV